MKTITFHSYKGGTGRTLALANFAMLLCQVDDKTQSKVRDKETTFKTILVIDYDFEAPSLPYKFNVEKDITGGYVDYLVGTKFGNEKSGRDLEQSKERCDLLKQYGISVSVQVGGNGYKFDLLPSGIPSSADYWLNLSKQSFHELFYFTESELNPSYEEKSILIDTGANWEAFKKDLNDIEAAFDKPDYCLIDCKTAVEYVSVPLFAWANHIIEFFSCNKEGVFGAILAIQSVDGSDDCDDNIKFTPVMTRISNNMDIEKSLEEFRVLGESLGFISDKARLLEYGEGEEEKKTKFHTLCIEMGIINAKSKLRLSEIYVLREQRDLEGDEKLLLNGKIENNVQLSHDYCTLLKEIFRDDKDVLNKLDNCIKESHYLDCGKMCSDRFFKYKAGELVNEDGESNVSLRRDSLNMLIKGLIDGLSTCRVNELDNSNDFDQRIVQVLRHTGLEAGKDFGRKRTLARAPSVKDRISRWCDFDSNAGFGMWTSEYDEAKHSGTILAKNNFLSGVEYGSSFIEGYIEGVLKFQISEDENPIEVVVSKSEKESQTFEFRHD